MYKEFEVPDAQELVEALGVEPQYLEFEEVAVLNLSEICGEDLTFSYSAMGRSVRLSWRKEERSHMNIYREGATRLHVGTEDQSTSIDVHYGFADAEGLLKVQIFPYVKVEDRLLFS